MHYACGEMLVVMLIMHSYSCCVSRVARVHEGRASAVPVLDASAHLDIRTSNFVLDCHQRHHR